ncbi:unnamed protein product [Orchesella dallaii]|uniref:Uncharacterized protein n=1 Tax=Orchesella dallaii TaxID=48710 RepID=A0ABP1S811_9HEXA
MGKSTNYISNPVPYLFHQHNPKSRVNKLQPGEIFSSFRHWTTCHSISFVLHNLDENVATLNEEQRILNNAYSKLGFKKAHDCLPFGQFCSSALPEYFGQKFFALFSATIFYILPASSVYQQNKFKHNFYLMYENHALQIPFKIIYPIVEVSKFEYVFGSNCVSITFMCKFCYSKRLEFESVHALLVSGYPFQDYRYVCPSLNLGNNYRYALSDLYFDATKDGINFTYFKLITGTTDDYILESTNISRIKGIQYAKSARNVLNINPKLDEIILSILLERMPKENENLEWAKLSLMPAVGAVSVTNWRVGLSTVPMESRSFNFISCDGKKSQIIHPFAYLEPFEARVWLALIIAILATFLLVHSCNYLENFNTKISSWTIVLYVVAIMLNTSFKINTTQKYLTLGGVLAVWLLTSIIISNAYKGDNFSKTTVPLWGSQMETLDEMRDFTIFTTNTCSDNYISLFGCTNISGDAAAWFLTVFGLNAVKLFGEQNYDKYVTNISELLGPKDVISFSDKQLGQMLLKIKPVFINSVDGIINYIGQCQKTAFIEENRDIQMIITKYHKRCNEHLYVGKEKLFMKTTVWNIQENGGYYMKRRMRYLESSGIHQFWKELMDYTAELVQNVPCPKKGDLRLSLTSNIILIFYAVLFLCLISFIALIVECCLNKILK